MDATKRMTCDFYTAQQWNAAAAQMAAMMQEHVFDRHFGVSPWLVERYFVFFGNEGRSNVAALMATVRQEIETIIGMREVGSGVSADSYSWAIIVDASCMSADGTDDVCDMMQEAIVRAWRIARGFLSDEPGKG